ncbi:MAG: SpoIIE family protein phosphatase, partial [Acidobacteria bacterium]|nr:SpoIIE family protein phosphatase [Acidobacteriota bacterium]
MKFTSLNRRYLWWAAIGFGLVLTFLCTVLVLYDSSRLSAALRQKLDNVVGLAQVSLTSAVWNLDEEVVKEMVKAIALDTSIVFIHVVSGETTLFRYLRPDYTDRQDASIGDSSKVIRNTADILRKDSKIGSIEVGISTSETRRQLIIDIIALVSIAVLIMAAIILTIYRVVERKRHEQALQEAYDVIKDQKERMENELNVGRDIQMSMVPLTFPYPPDRDEFLVYAKLKPARELGGDFYDFYFVDERRFFFCIGDVSGKGVPAALFMAVTKTLIKSRTGEDCSTASILTHINDELSKDNSSCMFVTLFAGILDVTTGEFIYTNAGHNPPYLR